MKPILPYSIEIHELIQSSSEENIEDEVAEKGAEDDFENFEYSLAKDLEHCTTWSFGLGKGIFLLADIFS